MLCLLVMVLLLTNGRVAHLISAHHIHYYGLSRIALVAVNELHATRIRPKTV